MSSVSPPVIPVVDYHVKDIERVLRLIFRVVPPRFHDAREAAQWVVSCRDHKDLSIRICKALCKSSTLHPNDRLILVRLILGYQQSSEFGNFQRPTEMTELVAKGAERFVDNSNVLAISDALYDPDPTNSMWIAWVIMLRLFDPRLQHLRPRANEIVGQVMSLRTEQ